LLIWPQAVQQLVRQPPPGGEPALRVVVDHSAGHRAQHLGQDTHLRQDRRRGVDERLGVGKEICPLGLRATVHPVPPVGRPEDHHERSLRPDRLLDRLDHADRTALDRADPSQRGVQEEQVAGTDTEGDQVRGQ